MSIFQTETDEEQPQKKVSIMLRLITTLLFAIIALGSAISSILIIRMFSKLKEMGSLGLAKTLEVIGESSIPAIVSLYLAALVGIVLIVILFREDASQTKTASPPVWFYVTGFLLSTIPAGLFWKAQFMILEVLSPESKIPKSEVANIGGTVSELMILSGVSAIVVIFILFIGSVLPFSTRSKSNVHSLTATIVIAFVFLASALLLTFSMP